MRSEVDNLTRLRGDSGWDCYGEWSMPRSDRHGMSVGTLPTSFTRQFRSSSKVHRTQQALLFTAAAECVSGLPVNVQGNNIDILTPQNRRTSTSSPVSPMRALSRKRPRTTSSCDQPRLFPSSPPAPVGIKLGGGAQWGSREGGLNSIETDWACSSSGATASTTSDHDGFSDVFSRPAAGSLGFGISSRVRPITAKRIRPRTVIINGRWGSLGNWPLNTSERWMATGVGREQALLRINKLREIRLRRLARQQLERAAKAAETSSSDSDDFEHDDDEGFGREDYEDGAKAEDPVLIEERRKLRKKARKRERKEKKREAERKSRWNRERWRTAGRHGGIVARAHASVPALSARGDLVQLKAHADRVLLAKLVRRWRVVATAFGVELPASDDEIRQSIPPPPGHSVTEEFVDFDALWVVLTGDGLSLTEVEADVVLRRIDTAISKADRGQGAEPLSGEEGGSGSGSGPGSKPVAQRGLEGAVDVEEISSSSGVTYSQVYSALFPADEAEALVAALGRDEELRRLDEQRQALKRQQFEDSMAQRRSNEIAEVEAAYDAGLGYPPDREEPENSVAAPLEWMSDGGVSNRWGATAIARKALFFALQAGAAAHLSLKERMAAEAPWVKGETHISIRAPKAAFVACAKYGRGFQGLKADQVVLALRVYAAERIQAQWRSLRPRRQFAPKILALRELVRREQALRTGRRVEAFGKWSRGHRNHMTLLRGTRRPFRRWTVETARSRRQADIFRGTFWPLYVWRRWTNYRISSADKSKFLKRAFLTFVLLRHFRAWNRLTDSGLRLTLRADAACAARRRARLRRVVAWWAARTRKNKALSKLWIRGGMWIRLRVKTRQVRSTFVILRYWAFARAACERRSDAHFRSYFLLGEMGRRQAMADRKSSRDACRSGRDRRNTKRGAVNLNAEDEPDAEGEYASQTVDHGGDEAEGKQSGRRRKGKSSTFTPHDPVLAVYGRPSYSSFPGVEATYFGEGVPAGTAIYACEVLREHFSLKESLKARLNFLLYQRLGPAMLARMRSKVRERQRARYASFYDAYRIQRKYLRALNVAARILSTLRRGITGQSLAMTLHSVVAGSGGDGNSLEQSQDSDARDSDIVSVMGFEGMDERLSILEEDRHARRGQVERSGVRLSQLLSRTTLLKEQSETDEAVTEKRLAARKRRERAVAKFLIREGSRARSADESARQFTAGFKRHAATNLVEVVERVFTEVVHGRRAEILHGAMKRWRLWYMQRVSVKLYNRQRMRNWLRICARLRYVWRGMPLYRQLRTKWSLFHRLMKLTDDRLRHGTQGLPAILRRRRELLLGYSSLLWERGFIPGRYVPQVITQPTIDERALVQRWKQYVQGRISVRLLATTLRRRRLARIAHEAFTSWRTGIGPKQWRQAALKAERQSGPLMEASLRKGVNKHTSEDELQQARRGPSEDSAPESPSAEVLYRSASQKRRRCFAERRADADLMVARRTIVAGWRGSLTRVIWLRQTREEWRLKKAARQEPNFKKFMAYHAWQANERVRTEARLLVDAFLNRGRLKFQDLEPAMTVGQSVDSSISSGLTPFRDKWVPGSYLVCEVRVMTRVGEGVVGVQLMLRAGGTRTEELPARGATAGESTSTRAHAFAVDAPVERLCRFECEYDHGLIERLRVVTSGGRYSQWFGERLSANPSFAMLPDWQHASLAATTAAAAVTARANVSSKASSSSGDSMSSEGRAAAVAAAEEAAAAAVVAPKWDPQKEYVTGLLGTKTHDRLVGLGVITRHVTSSHIFSYLWEEPDEGDAVCPIPSIGSSEQDGAQNDRSSNWSQPATASPRNTVHDQPSFRAFRGSDGSNISTSPSVSSFSPRSLAPSETATHATPLSGRSATIENTGAGAGNLHDGACESLSAAPTLSRAEAKQEKFAREMRERERKREERIRIAKEREENLERLMRGGKPVDESEESVPAAGTIGPKPPTPQEEFASVLRMRRTDARHALERSMALARAARKYRGRFGTDDGGSALSSLPAVMGLTTWFYAALLPRLVPLPVPATTTSELFHRAETALATARSTKAKADSLIRQTQELLENRQCRPRRGVLSPGQRANETKERENLRVWALEGAAFQEKARRQCDEGERLLDDAREHLPKVSQNVKTVRMYLEYLTLGRRQIELEREFGLGAMRTPQTLRGGARGQPGGGTCRLGGEGVSSLAAIDSCGMEETLFEQTIKSLLNENLENDGLRLQAWSRTAKRPIATFTGENGTERPEAIPWDTQMPFTLQGEGSFAAASSALDTAPSVRPWT